MVVQRELTWNRPMVDECSLDGDKLDEDKDDVPDEPDWPAPLSSRPLLFPLELDDGDDDGPPLPDECVWMRWPSFSQSS